MVRHYARMLLVPIALLLPAVARGQDLPREPGSELTVYVATIGPGGAVWEKFGHNAIWIRDALTRTTIAYNYGIFEFDQDRFIPRLMQGDMLYSMGVEDADAEVARYAEDDRSVWVQRLDLLPAQRHALREFLEWNWLPQNRHYHYDYFRDNCSTRVRDALDRALGGVLRAQLTGIPTGTTFRSHSLRLTAAAPAVHAGLLLGLGLPTDRPIDAWEESFIPMELMRHLRAVRIAGADGNARPLVAEEVTAFAATRPAPPDSPPNRLPVFFALGLLLATLILLLARAADRRPFVRLGLALAISFWGLVTGFFGLLLALLWLFTSHVAAYPNLNLFQTGPLGLLLAVAAPLHLYAAARGVASRTARLAPALALLIAILSLGGAFLQMFPGARQGSAPIVALALPVHLAIALALIRSGRRRPSQAEDGAGGPATPAAS